MASDDRRVEVVDDGGVGVFVALNHLRNTKKKKDENKRINIHSLFGHCILQIKCLYI